MSEESLKQLIELVRQSKELQKKIFSISKPEEIIKLAEENGLKINLEDLKQMKFDKLKYEQPELIDLTGKDGKLSQEQLEKVAGAGSSCRDGNHPGGRCNMGKFATGCGFGYADTNRSCNTGWGAGGNCTTGGDANSCNTGY